MGTWKQMYGLAPAAQLSEAILDIANSKEKSELTSASIEDIEPSETPRENSSAREYFTDVQLVDQNGNPQRLYSDLMRNRVVVISSFFSSCTGVCPILNRNLMKIKEAFANEMGESLVFLSLSVDPEVDTPARLEEYAESLHAGPGWYFLTGKRESLEFALSKLGMSAESRESHSNLFLIGNDRTGLWKKAFGLAPIEDVLEIVQSVLNDTGDNDPAVADAESGTPKTSQQ